MLRLPPKFKVNECLNTLCIPDTCSTIVLNKSCRQRWELEPDNFLPVRIVQQRIGVSHESRIYFHFLQSYHRPLKYFSLFLAYCVVPLQSLEPVLDSFDTHRISSKFLASVDNNQSEKKIRLATVQCSYPGTASLKACLTDLIEEL